MPSGPLRLYSSAICAMKEDGTATTSRYDMELITENYYTNLFRSTIPPAPDNITADFLRAGSHKLHALLATHLTSYLQKERIPDQWRTSRTVILPKKGDRRDIRNYRPICLLSVLYKLFTKIILSRISRTLDEAQPVEQAGFRKGFCCMDHIQTVSRVIEVCHEYHVPLVLTFIDYEKAFDRVETNAILSALVDQGVDPSYIRTLADCYRNCTTRTQLFQRPLTIPIRKGVRQGDTISPKLFNAALQWIMKSLDWDEKGIRIDGKFLSNLRFADDIVIFSSSTSEAETMLKELNEAGKMIRLRINRKKTQFMRNPWCEGNHIELDGSRLEETTLYVYLGRSLNKKNDMKEELTRRRRAA